MLAGKFASLSTTMVMARRSVHLITPFLGKLEEAFNKYFVMGAQCLSGWVLDSRPRDCGFEPHRRHCLVSSSNPSLVLVQLRMTRPYITERFSMGRIDSNCAHTFAYNWQLLLLNDSAEGGNIYLHESVRPGCDLTRDTWICSQTRICGQTRYWLPTRPGTCIREYLCQQQLLCQQ